MALQECKYKMGMDSLVCGSHLNNIHIMQPVK
uniref:Uncharacterized protein n=1 Tax=Nelumbo nucifera TaxID=4432 RepID=A0A822ZRA8_NELNU|nr:TPA_asm: hypothetical protein HUJ06_016967 [Nelumbo nucifera]